MPYSAYSVNRLRKEILHLEQKVRLLKKANQYLEDSFEARVFEAIEFAAIRYGSLLRPHPLEIEEKVGKTRNTFSISTAQIVCIKADELTKNIILIKPIYSKGGRKKKKQKIAFEGTWEELESKLPSAKILLCKVNKSTYVNALYYELNQNQITCLLAHAKEWNPCQELKLNDNYASRFKACHQYVSQLRSIEKRLVHFFPHP